MPLAPKIPLSFDEFYSYESIDDVVNLTRFHVKNVILTSPGEKISDPQFGVGIRSYLFENMTNTTFANIKSNIRLQLKKYIPHVEILSMEINSVLNNNTTNDNAMVLRLSYFIPIINKTDILSFDVSNSTAIY